MMKIYFLFLFATLSCHVYGDNHASLNDPNANKTFDGTYLIVAPRTVRPGLPYAVSVNILKSQDNKPVSVTVRIIDDSNKTVTQVFKDVSTGTPETVKIDKVPNVLMDGVSYRLQVSGQSHDKKPLFEQTQDVTFSSKALSVFVQSDKKIYKPGSVVHFRVVAIYPDLKPYKGIANVKVKDPNNNVVQQFSNVTFENGVLGKEDKMKIQLTEEPPLGDWNIIVEVSGQKTEYSFTVDKYVLPKFEVTVKPPPYITIKDDLPVTISAKYTYGKGVAGTATIMAEYPSYQEPRPPIMKSVDLDINGEAVVRYTNGALKESGFLPEYGYNNIKITATVTETLTGIQRNGTGSVNTYRQPYTVTINKAGDTFQPGLDFTISVVVMTQDSKPLPANADKKINVTTSYYFPYVYVNGTAERNDPIEISENTTLDADGTKTFTFKTLSNATSMRIEAKYGQDDTNTSSPVRYYDLQTSEYVEASKSPTKSYLQLRTKSASVHAGETAKFNIKSTADITTITAQVMNRGYMVFIKNIKVTNNEAEITIPTTNEMAPTSRLIVYAIRPDNKEILVSSMDLKVSGLFRNNVSISVDPKKAEPNDTVTFKVKASPKSYVGLLAVDQSVLILKSGNDITQADVEGDIAQYDTTGGGYYPWRGRFIERKKRSICYRCGWWGIGGKDAASIFENSGVLVFTDAYLYREVLPPNMIMNATFISTTFAPLATSNAATTTAVTPSSGSTKQIEQVAIRHSFPETWIWFNTRTTYGILKYVLISFFTKPLL